MISGLKTAFSILFLSLVAVTSVWSQPMQKDTLREDDYLKGYYGQIFGLQPAQIMNTKLYQLVEEWIGTPYKYAGKTASGIDCSSFAGVIYHQIYSITLSGGSNDIVKKVKRVEKKDLQEGDLVFFRINRRYTASHVGVYLGNDKFAHASVQSGVIVSDLKEPYYQKYFTQGGKF